MNDELRRALAAAWVDFLEAKTPPSDLPDHALVTFEQLTAIVEKALADVAEKAGQ